MFLCFFTRFALRGAINAEHDNVVSVCVYVRQRTDIDVNVSHLFWKNDRFDDFSTETHTES